VRLLRFTAQTGQKNEEEHNRHEQEGNSRRPHRGLLENAEISEPTGINKPYAKSGSRV
jgi:hypothetical protein